MAGSVISTFISVIPIIEIIFVVLLIREIIVLIRGEKKAANSSDLAAGFMKDGFSKKDQKIDENNAVERKLTSDVDKAKEGEEEDKNKLIEIQRLINGLTIQGKSRIERLLSGHSQLRGVATQKYFADIVVKISDQLIVPMNTDAVELKKEVAQLRKNTLAEIAVFRNLVKDIEKEKKGLETVNKKRKEKEVLLAQEMETIRSKSDGTLKTLNSLKSTNAPKEADVKKLEKELDLLTQKRITTKENLDKLQKEIQAEEDKAKLRVAKLNQIEEEIKKVQLPDDKKLQQIELSLNREIDAILKELTGLNTCLNNIHKIQVNSAADADKLNKEKHDNYDQKLPILGEHINQVVKDFESLSVIDSNMSGEVVKISNLMGGTKGELNMGATNELTKKPTAKGGKVIDFESASMLK